ncbi:PREDICTED: uncharacterized protein LOC109169360 [Ipomoea nil]|uniref:uncharacterized protein LOC109169360 n=1 Tax=Ipomoea nil TaxID=35883 RepID=UPI000900F965|nr:PREDICTED: uncharacterized protein LOC109169360 [Ipomoea nil]
MATNDSEDIKINIKIRDSQRTMRIYKGAPVLYLKQQIAVFTGVSSNRQQLIFRRRDLRNYKRLSDYNVEDGDTLHLINLDDGSSSYISEPIVRSLSRRGGLVLQRENEEDDFDPRYYVPVPNTARLSGGGPRFTIPPLQDSSEEDQTPIASPVREHPEQPNPKRQKNH